MSYRKSFQTIQDLRKLGNVRKTSKSGVSVPSSLQKSVFGNSSQNLRKNRYLRFLVFFLSLIYLLFAKYFVQHCGLDHFFLVILNKIRKCYIFFDFKGTLCFDYLCQFFIIRSGHVKYYNKMTNQPHDITEKLKCNEATTNI